MEKKYSIVIPTHVGHLEQVELFLKTYNKYSFDKEVIEINLIISENEKNIFTPLKNKISNNVKLEIISLKEVIYKVEKIIIDDTKLLKEIGKFNFQALKKIYGAIFADADTILILDSEALIIRDICFSEIFDNYTSKPFVFYSPYFGMKFQEDVTYLISDILNVKKENKWFLETQYWFFQGDILKSLKEHVNRITGESIFTLFCKNKPIFPEIFYYLFAFNFHNNRFKFINTEDLVRDFLPFEEYLKYKSAMGENTFEYFSWGLNNSNYNYFSKILDKYQIQFFKYDDRYQIKDNYEAQKALINENENIKLIPCRVVSKEFYINENLVYKNHDSINNKPIMFSNGNSISILNYLKSNKYLKKTYNFFKKIKQDLQFNRDYTRIKNILDNNDSINLKYKNSNIPVYQIKKNLAFDVGAFTGNSINRLKSLGYDNIVCFEPSKRNFTSLYNSAILDKNITFIHRAASETPNQLLTFYSNKHLPWLNTLHSDWLKDTRHSSNITKIKKDQVKTISLDWVIQQTGYIPSYIKIDTEGHEISALKGLTYKPEILSFEWISERKESLLDCLEYCYKLGFEQFYIEIKETIPEFEKNNGYSYEQAKDYINKICKYDIDNNLGGNIWCN
jgi:FkbM family methyltransferase